jgi:hypothetical protein
MKKISVSNYRGDKYYPRVVRAVEAILAKGRVVAPIDVFVQLDLLSTTDLEAWRFGRVPYLEKVIRCNLEKASRILRILRLHAHDLSLRPSQTYYRKWGKGPKIPLRFSKSADRNIEEAYARHFVAPTTRLKKQEPAVPEGSDAAAESEQPMGS